MARSEATSTMPAMRRAWLREMGVETLWLGAPAQAVGMASASTASRPPATDATVRAIVAAPSEQTARAGGHPSQAHEGTAPDRTGLATATVQAGSDVCAIQQAARTQAQAVGRLLIVSCIDLDGVKAPWLVFGDETEVGAEDAAQWRFLLNLLRAAGLAPGAREGYAVGADALDPATAGEWRASLLQGKGGNRVLLLGDLARRAFAPESLAGDVAAVRCAGATFAIGVLPALADVSAEPDGKARAWRVLRSLAGVPLGAA